MKQFATFLIFNFTLCFSNIGANAQTTYLSQDFSSSTNVNDYVSSTPNNGQFNSISISNGTVSINNGELEYDRTGSGSGILSRTTDFSPEPGILTVEFDLTVPSSAGSQTTAAILYLGQNFATGTAVPTTANVHSRIGVNFVGNSGGFSLRRITSPASSSATFTGEQRITWIVNNSGSTYTYTAPDGSTQTLGNDAADLYVGTTLVFDEIPATTGGAAITDFKFIFNGGSGSTAGTIRLDDFLITAPEDAPLPVEFADFTLSPLKNNAVQLSWATASELNNAGFEIYRSEDNDKAFKKIASYETNPELIGMGTSAYGKKYSFIDDSDFLQSGNTYSYKVVSVDFDGTRNSHEAKSIEYNSFQNIDSKSSARIYPNPTADHINISFSIAEDEKITVIMSDITGKTVYSTHEDHPSGNVNFSISTRALPLGIYNVVIKTRDNIYTHNINVSR